ncbi:hypothetical protein MTR72_16445 [Bradyrhizobium sp. ISRA442]|uniref:hypothetical protein n=1 Tax=Bradyrhizobium sp. ISRA442 TaxID=2866197 RepID=UPI00311B1129
MTDKVTIFHRDGTTRKLPQSAAQALVWCDDNWSFSPPPPDGWEFETPRYRAAFAVNPAPRERYRHERPFTDVSDAHCWQYAERPVKAGEIIETRSWPHPCFRPLNYSAKRVHEFFTKAQKSRMTVSPWCHDRIRLDDGLSGPLKVVLPKREQAA